MILTDSAIICGVLRGDDMEVYVYVSRKTENSDSIEIGTPGKGGAVKVYGDFANPDEFQKKVRAAYELRNYAAELMGGR